MSKPIGEYLGDGVYATHDGWGITLDLRKQDASRIYLEPDVRKRLREFEARASAKLQEERLREADQA